MKLYRCDLCGRVFSQKTPHKCYGGCFRKHSLTFTEFEDSDFEYVKKSETDVKEKLSTKIWQAPHILTELPASNIEYFANWEQTRVDAAVAAMNGILSNPDISLNFEENEEGVTNGVTKVAVKLADALVEKLKNKK